MCIRDSYHIGPTRDDNMIAGVDLERVAEIGQAQFVLNTGPSDWDETVAQYEPLLQAALARAFPERAAAPKADGA